MKKYLRIPANPKAPTWGTSAREASGGAFGLIPACWSPVSATVVFIRLLVANEYEEETAFAQLIAKGCPVPLADAAWESWSQGTGA